MMMWNKSWIMPSGLSESNKLRVLLKNPHLLFLAVTFHILSGCFLKLLWSLILILSLWHHHLITPSESAESKRMKSLLMKTHLINWEESNILAKDSERNTRWIRESIWIRREGGTNYKRNLMNVDEGPINLIFFMISWSRGRHQMMTSQRQDQDQRSQPFDKTSW